MSTRLDPERRAFAQASEGPAGDDQVIDDRSTLSKRRAARTIMRGQGHVGGWPYPPEMASVPQSTDFVWEEARLRLEAQLRQADALDTKAGALLGLHVVAAGFLVSIHGSVIGANRPVAVAVIAGLVVSGAFAFLAYRIESYEHRPRPEALWRLGDLDASDIRLHFLSTRFEALEENRRRLARKARRLAGSLSILAVLALTVAVVSIVELVA